MIQMPMSFIGGSIRQAFLQRSAATKHNGTLPELVNEICSVLIMLSVMPLPGEPNMIQFLQCCIKMYFRCKVILEFNTTPIVPKH